MQKKLLTVAVAGVLAAPVSAMAAVTVYGTIDTGIRMQTDVVTATGTDSLLTVTDGTRTTNRWGLRGSEDLGGGLKANFTLEGQYGSATGALGSDPSAGTASTLTGSAGSTAINQGLFQRKAIVGLSGAAWSVDLGRDYTVNFKTQGVYDPMSYTYTGITPAAGNNVAGTRHSNLITAGFRFGTGGIRLDYSMGEVAGDNTLNTSYGINGDFAFGNLTLVAAYTTRTLAVTGDEAEQNVLNFGGAWKMGAWTFRAGYSTSEYSLNSVGDVGETPMIMAGVQYGFSPTLNGRFGYYTMDFDDAGGNNVGSRDWLIFAIDYYLSKNTTLYAAIDINNIDGNTFTVSGTTGQLTLSTTAGQGSVLGVNSEDGSTGFTVGIAHAF